MAYTDRNLLFGAQPIHARAAGKSSDTFDSVQEIVVMMFAAPCELFVGVKR